jgi:succinate-semialdehyde dehydrogenase/glutarate-semialdehyde dehydrogenase
MALEAGIPPEAAQWILGDGSVFLPLWMQHPGVRKVSLTGSTRVGKILMDQASVTLKRLALELGGDAPWMMFDDADPMEAASLLYAAKMRNMGQSCTAANRLFVTRRRHDALLEALVSHARSVVRIGDGADESTTVGPLTLTSASRRLGSWLDRAHEGGARVVESWDLPLGCNSGYFFPPCIVTEVDGTMDLGCQEIFGPIFAIQPCEDEADMMKRALQTQHGLAAYAVGQDPDRLAPFLARAEVGMLGWNQSRISHAEIPFGGWRSSGVGREGGIEGLLAFCDTRTVIRSSQVACFNGPKDNIRS